MIKKLNKEIDSIPLVIKIILCLAMIILITFMSILFAGVVNAQTINMTNWAWKDSNGNWTFVNTGDTTSMIGPVQLSFNFNDAPGNNNGTVYFEADVNGSISTNDITTQWWTNPNPSTTGTVSKNCTVTQVNLLTNHVRCQLNFTITNTSQNLNIILNFANGRPFSNATASGSTDYQPTDNATTSDIVNQTIQISNQIIQSVQEAINNTTDVTNDVIYQLSNAITNATQTIIGNDLYCNLSTDYGTSEEHKYLQANGSTGSADSYNISEYINIKNGKVTVFNSSYSGGYACFYDIGKNVISCYQQSNSMTKGTEITVPQDAVYFRYTIYSIQNKPIYQVCKNRIDAIIENQNSNTDKIINADDERYQAYLQYMEQTNTSRWTEEDEIQEEQTGLLQSILSSISSLFSSDVDDPDDDISGLNNKFADNNVISNLLLLPVRIYQNVLNNINGTCNTFNLGALWGHNLTMTCIRVDSLLGSALYGVIDVIISGFFVYHIRKKFVDIFEHLTSLKTGGNELE